MHRGKKLGLDSAAAVAFLSHAHSDHLGAVGSNNEIIASKETLVLADVDGESAVVEGARLIDAGHILGARQLVLEGEEKIIYTGDISFKPNIFGFSAKMEECDRLIMESTYAAPEYRFRDTFEVYAELAKWVTAKSSSNLIIGAYELGKAQEIVRVLNEYCKIAPIVPERADDVCSVYEEFGYKLDRLAVGSDEAEEAMKRSFVAVVPMRLAKRSFAQKLETAFERETLVAVATGWAMKYRYNADAAFTLSDHADFEDLVGYVEHSGAKTVEFFEGDGRKVLDAAGKRLCCLNV
ncbi:MAG: hypothetical protein V1492_03810 [Candidatus Micrarchaeota archaeon]